MDYSYHREHQKPSTFLDKRFELFFVLKLKGREKGKKIEEFQLIITVKIIQFKDSNCPKHIQEAGLQLFD